MASVLSPYRSERRTPRTSLELVRPEPVLLTPEQAAQRLGTSAKVIRRLYHAGLLVGVAHGTRSFRFTADALAAYLAGQRGSQAANGPQTAQAAARAECPDCAALRRALAHLGQTLTALGRDTEPA